MTLSDRNRARPDGILIVDDDNRRHRLIMANVRPRPSRAWHAYNAADGIRLLATFRRRISRVFLDFDLDFGETGMAVAKYMIDHEIRIPVTVVSQNPVGRPAIVGELRSAGFDVTSHPIIII